MKISPSFVPAPVLRQWRAYLAKKKSVASAVVFGSRARGDATAVSDIDVAIAGSKLTQREWLEISAFLEEQTESLLTVQAVRWEGASRSLKKKISNEGITLYERS